MAKKQTLDGLRAQPVYMVALSGRDTAGALHGPLARARRAFYEKGRTVRVSGTETAQGVPVKYSGKITRSALRWREKSATGAFCRTFTLRKEDVALFYDARGFLQRRMVFCGAAWLRSDYFDPQDSARPVESLSADPTQAAVLHCVRRAGTEEYDRSLLFPVAVPADAALGSYINSVVGEPRVMLFGPAGDFICCTAPEKERREALAAAGMPGPEAPVLQAPEETEAGQPAPVPPVTAEEAPAAESVPLAPVGLPQAPTTVGDMPELPPSLAFLKDILTEEEVAVQAPPAPAVAEEPAVTEEPAAAEEETPAAEEPAAPEEAPPAEKSADEATDAQEDAPVRFSALLEPKDGLTLTRGEETYRYVGETRDGLRHGRGRTECADGRTAYDGDYVQDKREGFGSLYYKNGGLCYAGGWQNNRRQGLGVSFRKEDNSLHVGKWEQGARVGMDFLFDKDGRLCVIRDSGDGEGKTVFCIDNSGTVISGLPEAPGEGRGSEFDADGNIVYTGMHKNGLRHGEGTSFTPDGRVEYTGRWENGVFTEGIFFGPNGAAKYKAIL